MSQAEQTTVELAIGRIFRMGSRPTQPGDAAEYERCRAIVMSILGGDEDAHRPGLGPAPGWNFGSGTSGCIE